jgi:FtsH-binding integral membrane protein
MPIDLNSMRNSRPALVQTGVDTGFRDYIRAIYTYMAGGLALTGVVAYYAFTTGLYLAIARTPLIWLVVFAPLVMVMFLSFRINKMSLVAAQTTYWVYAAVMGLSLAGIFMMYTGQSIARVFFVSSGTFGAMSLYGYTTKSDLTRWGSFLFMGLIGVIIAGVVNIFLQSSALQFAVSVMGVLVFVGLTAYDTQKIKEMYVYAEPGDTQGKKVVMGALRLYLDFINLFLMLLRLFGGRRN